MPEDRRENPDRREESIGSQMTRLEGLIEGVSKEISATREAAEHGVELLTTRVSLLEVNVRALEDWKLSQKVIAAERERVAREAADRAEQAEEQRTEDHREDLRRRVSRLQFWAGIAVTSIVAILAALISTGKVF